MRKIVKIFIILLVFTLSAVLYMVYKDKNYLNRLKSKIIDNTAIKSVDYVNCYGEYYIVLDSDYLYLYDDKYQEILKEDRILLHENTNDYDIIYKNGKFMYYDSYMKDDVLVEQYYNLYDYQLLDEVLVGGRNDKSS